MKYGRTSRIFAAALGVWAVWCVIHAGGQLDDWHQLAKLKFTLPVPVLSLFWRLPAALCRHVALVLAAGAIAIGLLNIGDLTLRPLRTPPPGPAWERRVFALLVGFVVLGVGYLGLALTGLFYGVLIYGIFAASLAMPGSVSLIKDLYGMRPGAMRDASRAQPGRPPVATVALGQLCWPGRLRRPARWYALVATAFAPGVIAVLAMLLPDTNGDALTYHLAAADQFLRTHRFTASSDSVALQYPLTGELVCSLAVGAGQDALPHLILFLPFAAAVALLLGWCFSRGGAAAGWIAAGGIACFGLVDQMAVIAKNDLAAAAYPIAGAVCLARGIFGGPSAWLRIGAVIFGCGASVKYNGLILMGVAVLAMAVPGPRSRSRLLRRDPACLGLAVLPVIPWLLKSWLMVGDPVWPQLAAYLPGALWDPESERSLALVRGRGVPGLMPLDFPLVFMRAVVANHLGLALALPLVLAGAGSRGKEAGWLLAYATAGFAVLWLVLPLEDMRYALPVFVVLIACAGVVLAAATAGWKDRTRRLVMAVGIAAGWLPLGRLLSSCLTPVPGSMYLSGMIDREEYLGRRLTTYWSAGEKLKEMPGLRGLLAIGEPRCYHLPGRFLPEMHACRTWAWVLSRQCTTAEGIRIKLRQMDCRHVLYNFVGESFPDPCSSPYAWDERMLAVWRDFVARYLDVLAVPRTVDGINGGFCVYGVRPASLNRPPGFLPYLPGIGSLYYGVLRHRLEGDLEGWLGSALELQRRIPGVDYISDLVAWAYEEGEQWRKAYDYYTPGFRHGTVGVENIWGMAKAAACLERWEEACSLIAMASAVFPEKRLAAWDVGTQIERIIAMRRQGAKVKVIMKWAADVPSSGASNVNMASEAGPADAAGRAPASPAPVGGL